MDWTGNNDEEFALLWADECLELGNIAEFQADYLTAVTHYQKAFTLYGNLKHTLGLVEVHLKLGAVYVQQSSHDLAKNEFESALQMAIDYNLYMCANDAHLGLAQVLQRQGCYQESYRIVNQAILDIQNINVGSEN